MLASTFIAVALAAVANALPTTLDPAAGPPMAAMPKAPVAGDVWDKINHYAIFVGPSQDYPQKTCKTPPYGTSVVKFYSTVLTDTQALLYRDDARKEFILAIPGTSGLTDQVLDTTTIGLLWLAPGVRCQGLCIVHAGFLAAWTSLYTILQDDLRNNIKQNPGYSTVITGHSLGGAIAQLAFANLKSDPAFNVKEAYSYGQPRVGNADFANNVDQAAGASELSPGIYYRVTHANDPIPNSIPSALGFRHSLTEYWEMNMMPSEQTTFRCFTQEAGDCSATQSGESLTNMPAHTTYANLEGYNCGN